MKKKKKKKKKSDYIILIIYSLPINDSHVRSYGMAYVRNRRLTVQHSTIVTKGYIIHSCMSGHVRSTFYFFLSLTREC